MVRTQVQLTDEQSAALKEISARSGRSVSDLVREGVEGVIARSASPSREELVRRALSVVGKFSSGKTDISRNHDDYFVEAILASKK